MAAAASACFVTLIMAMTAASAAALTVFMVTMSSAAASAAHPSRLQCSINQLLNCFIGISAHTRNNINTKLRKCDKRTVSDAAAKYGLNALSC